jgi:nucleotide-binding universal stress UspA family protein
MRSNVDHGHLPLAHALEIIALLATGYGADVDCFLIEDADMLGAAGLPFALEVCRATNVVRPVNSQEIERGLKKRASTIRKLVAETSARSGKNWSFEILRRRTTSALLELAKQTDVMMFAAASSTRFTPWRQGAQMSAKEQASGGTSIVVLVEQSSASDRAVQVAHKLSELRGIPIHALVVADSDADLHELSKKLHVAVDISSTHIHWLRNTEFGHVADRARALRPAAIVVPRTLVKGSSARIRTLEETVESPVLVVK